MTEHSGEAFVVIGPELIARAARLGACSDALAWLREEPRTWRELRERDAGWIVWGIAHGLADSVLPELMQDPDTGVRRQVAWRIDPAHLPAMVSDQDAIVRRHVAARIAPSHLAELMRDPDTGVRCAVADRIDPARLPAMVSDTDANVRGIVAQRLGGGS